MRRDFHRRVKAAVLYLREIGEPVTMEDFIEAAVDRELERLAKRHGRARGWYGTDRALPRGPIASLPAAANGGGGV